MSIVLITSLYKARDANRRDEYNRCLEINCRSMIDKIVVLFEGDGEDCYPALAHDKVEVHRIDERPSYGTLIDHANQYHRGDFIIMSNADIYFDQDSNIDRIKELKLGQMWALSRYNTPKNGNLHLQTGGNGSYDSYLFCAPLKTFNQSLLIGVVGCDSLFVLRAMRGGLQVSNPCFSIIAKHLHYSQERNMNIADGEYKNYWEHPDFKGKSGMFSYPLPSRIESQCWKTDSSSVGCYIKCFCLYLWLYPKGVKILFSKIRKKLMRTKF